MSKQQYTGRTLRRNHSNALPRYIIAYAVESTKTTLDSHKTLESEKFKCGVAVTARFDGSKVTRVKLHRLSRPNAIWDLLDKHSAMNFTTWLVGHSLLTDLIQSDWQAYMEEGRASIEWPRTKRKKADNEESNLHSNSLCVIEDAPTIIAFKIGATQGRCVAVDIRNWFDATLNELSGFEDNRETNGELSDSLSNCINSPAGKKALTVFRTFVELINWVKTNDFGMFRYTAASQSMACFRHKFMRHEILLHDNKDVRKLERSGYYGGRTSVFRQGKIYETVHQLDVSSLFPAIMREGLFPKCMYQYGNHNFRSGVPAEIDYGCAVAEVILDTPEPIFPLREKHATIYPAGRFRTVLCGPELRYANRRGYILSVGKFAEYRTDGLFTDFVDSLWAMRVEYKRIQNRLYDQFAKRILNSLYGKFGQMSSVWQNKDENLSALPWSRWSEANEVTGEATQFRSVGWQVQKKCEREEMEGTFPAISAFVTSYARMRMNGLRHLAGHENVYYQGVDSLVVTNKGLDRLTRSGEINENALGKLRIQLSTNTGEIIGCADYKLGDKTVVGGRKKDNWLSETGETLHRKMSIDKYLFSGRRVSEVYSSAETWNRKGKFLQGIIQPDGWVKPFNMTTLVTSSIGGTSDASSIPCASMSANDCNAEMSAPSNAETA